MSDDPLVLLSDIGIAQNNASREVPYSLSRIARAFGFLVNRKMGTVLSIDSTECFALPSSQIMHDEYKSIETLSIALEEFRRSTQSRTVH
jgi:hypothetical protein